MLALATRYLRITFLLMGLMVSMQIFHSVLQGAGDATTPMIVTFLVTPISIGAEWALAFGHLGFPALGITGIALGAGVGGAFGLVAAGWALFGYGAAMQGLTAFGFSDLSRSADGFFLKLAYLFRR